MPDNPEICCECREPTGRRWQEERDRLVTFDGKGPFCENCWAEIPADEK
jgi:hypothetical protein